MRWDAIALGEAPPRDCLVLAEFIRSVAPKVSQAPAACCLCQHRMRARLICGSHGMYHKRKEKDMQLDTLLLSLLSANSRQIYPLSTIGVVRI